MQSESVDPMTDDRLAQIEGDVNWQRRKVGSKISRQACELVAEVKRLRAELERLNGYALELELAVGVGAAEKIRQKVGLCSAALAQETRDPNRVDVVGKRGVEVRARLHHVCPVCGRTPQNPGACYSGFHCLGCVHSIPSTGTEFHPNCPLHGSLATKPAREVEDIGDAHRDVKPENMPAVEIDSQWVNQDSGDRWKVVSITDVAGEMFISIELVRRYGEENTTEYRGAIIVLADFRKDYLELKVRDAGLGCRTGDE